MRRNRTRRLPRAGVWRAFVFGGVVFTKEGGRGQPHPQVSGERHGRKGRGSSRVGAQPLQDTLARPECKEAAEASAAPFGAAAAPKWEGVLHGPGIEPGPPAWQARILPLNHPCTDGKCQRKLAQRNSPPAAVHWSPPAVGLRPIGASTRGWPDGASRRRGSRHVEGPGARRGGRAEGERPTPPVLRFLCRPEPRDCPPGSPGEGPAVARARMPVRAAELWRALLSADRRPRPRVFLLCLFCFLCCCCCCSGRAGHLACVSCGWVWGWVCQRVSERARRWGTGLAAAACGSETQTKSVGASLLRSDPGHRLALGVRPRWAGWEAGARERSGGALWQSRSWLTREKARWVWLGRPRPRLPAWGCGVVWRRAVPAGPGVCGRVTGI